MQERGETTSGRASCALWRNARLATLGAGAGWGLVERGVLRVEQGRGTHLHLTEAGRALVEERVRPVAEAETAAFVAMGSRDSEELLRLTHLHLELLREQVEALPYPDGR